MNGLLFSQISYMSKSKNRKFFLFVFFCHFFFIKSLKYIWNEFNTSLKSSRLFRVPVRVHANQRMSEHNRKYVKVLSFIINRQMLILNFFSLSLINIINIGTQYI